MMVYLFLNFPLGYFFILMLLMLIKFIFKLINIKSLRKELTYTDLPSSSRLLLFKSIVNTFKNHSCFCFYKFTSNPCIKLNVPNGSAGSPLCEKFQSLP